MPRLLLRALSTAAAAPGAAAPAPRAADLTPAQRRRAAAVFPPGTWHASQLATLPAAAISAARDALPATGAIDPVAFGADPTGANDSSDAFDAAVAAMRGLCRTQHGAADGRLDCGGATLDLVGGAYAVSRPVALPAGMGNVRVQRGTLRALPAFPADRFLLHIGAGCDGGHLVNGTTGCQEDVGVTQVTFEAEQRAAGGVWVDGTQYANVGPGIMVTGWREAGISLSGSGGGMVHEAFLGEYRALDAAAHKCASLNGTAIALGWPEHDSYVQNVIIWSAKIGVAASGGAEQLIGIHVWNTCSPRSDTAGIGIYLKGKARLKDSYIDTVPMVIQSFAYPGERVVIGSVTGTYFLHNASILLRPYGNANVPLSVRGLVITGNRWECGDSGHVCPRYGAVALEGELADVRNVSDTDVSGNVVPPAMVYRSTRAEAGVRVENATEAAVDFAPALLFAAAPAAARCWLAGGEPRGVSAAPAADGSPAVRVRIDGPYTGDVRCEAEQGTRSHLAR